MATKLQEVQAESIRIETQKIRELVEPTLEYLQKFQPSKALRKLTALRNMLERYRSQS